MQRFTDRVVAITGAGSGIGRATALRLASEGAVLSLVDVDGDQLETTVTAVREPAPEARILATVVDVRHAAHAERYLTRTLAHYGRVDGFVNNAAVMAFPGLTEAVTSSEFDEVVEVNLTAAINGLECVLDVMRSQGSGAVVNMTATGGLLSAGSQAAYVAASSGVVGLTRHAATERLGPAVRVNAVAPGMTLTRMTREYARPARSGESPGRARPNRSHGTVRNTC